MRLLFHPEAALEFEEAIRFYRSRGRTLGERFATEVRKTINQILEHPERWRKIETNVRRCLVKVFPYTVFYTIEEDYILILAVMHHKRYPGYWHHRLGPA